MALVVPLAHAQVIHSFQMAGDPDPFAITYGLKVAEPPIATSVNDLALEAEAHFTGTVFTEMSNQLTLVQTELIWQGTAPPDAPSVGVASTNTVGGNSGATVLLPQNNALLVHKRTNLAGRKGRGRLYLPGVAEGWASNTGVVDSSTKTTINAELENWRLAVLGSDNFEYLVLFHDDQSLTPLPAPTALTAMVLDAVIGTQRRRLRH